MNIIVGDANVFIHFYQLDIIHEIAQLEIKIITTEEVYDELRSDQQLSLVDVIHETVELTDDEYDELDEEYDNRIIQGISYPDMSVCYLADKRTCVLATNERALKKQAKHQNVDTKGTLYFCKLIAEKGLIDCGELERRITTIIDEDTRAFPRKEVTLEYISQWECD